MPADSPTSPKYGPPNLVHIALYEHDHTMLTSPDGKRVEVSLSAIAALIAKPPPMLAAGSKAKCVAVRRELLERVLDYIGPASSGLSGEIVAELREVLSGLGGVRGGTYP